MNKFIVIIRPEFMLFCEDACKAATLNHLLYRIAFKCKDQPKENIQAGKVLWYGSNEQITKEMSDAWGVCKVRKEINNLVHDGLFGRTTNPTWGVDRTKHFYFSEKECAVFLQLCDKHKICFVHLDLPDEVKHLIYSSNANDKSIKCICLNHQMQPIDQSDASDTYIEAITKIDYKDIHEDNTKEESTLSSPIVDDALAPIDLEEKRKKRDTDPRIPAIPKGHATQNGYHPDSGTRGLQHHSDGLHDSDGNGSQERRREDVATDRPGHATQADAAEGQLGAQTATVPPVLAVGQAANGAHVAPTFSPPPQGVQRGAGAKRVHKHVTQAKPSLTLDGQQQAFWDLWCNVWFNAEIKPVLTETAYGHISKLAPYITTQEQLDSLIDYTRKDVAESIGMKRKMVQLGNMVHCYAGWKQAQKPISIHDAHSAPQRRDFTGKGRLLLEAQQRKAGGM